MKNNKLILTLGALLFFLTGCTGSYKDFSSTDPIQLVSREAGSGTRTAFIEMTSLLKKTDTTSQDLTSPEAIIQNATDAVLTIISTNKNAIGYVSFASLNETVKTLDIDGVKADIETVKNKEYSLYRPFILVSSKKPDTMLMKDFIDFSNSTYAKTIIEEDGYIFPNEPVKYYNSDNKGKLSIAGSTSIAPLLEKIAEGYISQNPHVTIDIQATGSSAGVEAVNEGIVDFGMVSRELTSDELDTLEPIDLALDGIAVIVHKNNTTNNITTKELQKIFTGDIIYWNELEEGGK